MIVLAVLVRHIAITVNSSLQEASLLFSVKKAMSFCSGYGTSDMARAAVVHTVNTSQEMLQSAAEFELNISAVTCWDKNHKCHQLLADHSRWCNAVMNVTVPLADQPCIFSDILSLVPPGSYDPDASFLDRYFQLRKQTGTVSSLFPLALHLNVLGPLCVSYSFRSAFCGFVA